MKLTNEQQEIVDSESPFICCMAVPGSGKTSTLVARICRMIERGTSARTIVVITYTVAAADHLKNKLAELGVTDLQFVGTLHSFAFRYLQSVALSIGFTQRLSLMPQEDRANRLHAHLEQIDFDGSMKSFEAEVKRVIPAKMATFRPQGVELAVVSWFASMLNSGELDYDGILYWAIRGMRNRSGGQTVNLLWDEGQDMSEADHNIFQLIKCESRFIVGDVNQAIFGFRGGDPAWMERISRSNQFVNFRLTESFRLGSQVAISANALISRNWKYRDDCPLIRTDRQSFVKISECKSIDDDVEWIGALAKTGHPDLSVAVLLRTNYLVGVYSEQLKQEGVEVAKVEPPTFPADWPFIKAGLSAFANPDNDQAVAKFYVMLSGNLVTVESILRQAAIKRKSVNEMLNVVPSYTTVEGALSFLDKRFFGSTSVGALTKIAERLLSDGAVGIADLQVAISQIEQESVQRSSGVTVSTYHSAKGLEWDWVFMPMFCDELTPGKRPEQIEEERRLVYVAITRAKQELFISYPKTAVLNAFSVEAREVKPSRFITEMTI